MKRGKYVDLMDPVGRKENLRFTRQKNGLFPSGLWESFQIQARIKYLFKKKKKRIKE